MNMLLKKALQRTLLPAVALAMLLAPAMSATEAQAQTPKPVVVVSVSGVDELMGDIDYITKSAGVEDYGNLFKLLAAPYTVGVDKTKPWGMIVRMNEDARPQGLAFVPVKDLDVVFAALKEQIGEPRDLGDGVFELTDPAPMFVKEKGGFAFLSNEKKHLKALPEAPVKLLGDLPKKYDIGVRAFVQNIPQAQRQMAIDTIRDQQQRTLEQQLRDLEEDDPQYKLAKRLSENQARRLEDMINDADEVTVGWTTDEMSKQTYLDFTLTAKAGTPTAKRMKLLAGNETAFGGIRLDDAAVTMTITSKMAEDDVEQLTFLVDTAKAKAFEEIENDEDLDTAEKREKAKEVVGGLMDTLKKTAEAGKLDGGAALVLKPKSMSFVAGGAIAEPKALEDALRKLVDLAKDEPDFPEVTFDAETHRNVVFHTMTAPVPEDEEQAREVLGETLDVVVGIGEDAAYLSFGDDATGMLKKVIDNSTMKVQDVPPMHLKVALTPIFKFAASIEDNPILELITTTLEETEGNDQVIVKATPVKHGVNYRLTVQEGVLKAIGQAAKFRGGGL